MREILFRGKRADNGEWVEGTGINTQYDVRGEKHTYIGVLTRSQIYPSPMQTITWYEVIPETVGQYTGLTDKNGKEIFEGDIVIDKYSKEKFGFVGVVIYNPKLTQFQIYSDKQPDYVVNLGSRVNSIKVLGNIHDNPELLKGGER